MTQIDGAVVPQNAQLQAALDRTLALGGEGTPGLLSAIFDSAVVPEVFLIPKEANNNFRTAELFDIEESAGYESTFGWYNVADPTNLHPVPTCTPTSYEAAAKISVSFQTEFTAGHYSGDYVGFFLVSPGSMGGCGNPANLGVPGNTAFIVYPESQLGSGSGGVVPGGEQVRGGQVRRPVRNGRVPLSGRAALCRGLLLERRGHGRHGRQRGDRRLGGRRARP